MGFFNCCGNCWNRTPCTTVLAFLIYVCGVTFYMAAAYVGIQDVNHFFDFNEDMETLSLCLYFVCIGIGVYFLVLSICTTGDTGKELCEGNCCNIGGNICQLLTMAVGWSLNLMWVIVSALTIVPVTFFFMLNFTCELVMTQGSKQRCVTLLTWGVHPVNSSTICGKTAKQFCKKNPEIVTEFLIAYAASIAVCISLVTFLMMMASNYATLKTDYKNKEEKGEYQKMA